MALETRDSPAVHSGRGVSSWVLVPSVLAVAVASAWVGTWWASESLRAELTLRPPVVLFDMAGAVRDVPPAQLANSVARETARARRLAEGGVLVLDAQAVVAAPPDLYLAPRGNTEPAGEATR
jgi:hypothetical protein